MGDEVGTLDTSDYRDVHVVGFESIYVHFVVQKMGKDF